MSKQVLWQAGRVDWNICMQGSREQWRFSLIILFLVAFRLAMSYELSLPPEVSFNSPSKYLFPNLRYFWHVFAQVKLNVRRKKELLFFIHIAEMMVQMVGVGGSLNTYHPTPFIPNVRQKAYEAISGFAGKGARFIS